MTERWRKKLEGLDEVGPNDEFKYEVTVQPAAAVRVVPPAPTIPRASIPRTSESSTRSTRFMARAFASSVDQHGETARSASSTGKRGVRRDWPRSA